MVVVLLVLVQCIKSRRELCVHFEYRVDFREGEIEWIQKDIHLKLYFRKKNIEMEDKRNCKSKCKNENGYARTGMGRYENVDEKVWGN